MTKNLTSDKNSVKIGSSTAKVLRPLEVGDIIMSFHCLCTGIITHFDSGTDTTPFYKMAGRCVKHQELNITGAVWPISVGMLKDISIVEDPFTAWATEVYDAATATG